MRYRYRAVDVTGAIRQGWLECTRTGELEPLLARQGLILIQAWVDKGSLLHHYRNKLGRRDLIHFCFHLEQLIQAGIPLIEGLCDLRDTAENTRLRQILGSLVADVEGGQPLSQAMAAHPAAFNAVLVHMIRAGEASGTLPEVLRQLAETLKWQDELAAQTRKILLYPAFVGLLVCGVTVFLMVFLLPRLADFVTEMGQTLPISTRLLMAIASLLTQYGLPAVPGIILLALMLVTYLRRRSGWPETRDGWFLRLPLLGSILRKIILARFARFFAMLFAAGIPVLDCLHISAGVVGNACIAQALERLGHRIVAGSGIAAGFGETGLFPPLLLRMLHVGEATGALDVALRNIAYFYSRDVRESIAQVQSLIEPVLVVTLGLLLAWIMSAVLGPVFDTIGTLR